MSYYFLLLPQSIAINLSYMFPSATPSQALVFGIGYVKLKDMVRTNKFHFKKISFMDFL